MAGSTPGTAMICLPLNPSVRFSALTQAGYAVAFGPCAPRGTPARVLRTRFGMAGWLRVRNSDRPGRCSNALSDAARRYEAEAGRRPRTDGAMNARHARSRHCSDLIDEGPRFPGPHEDFSARGQPQRSEALMSEFYLHQVAPLRAQFHLYLRPGGIDTHNGCREMAASAVGRKVDIEQVGTDVEQRPVRVGLVRVAIQGRSNRTAI